MESLLFLAVCSNFSSIWITENLNFWYGANFNHQSRVIQPEILYTCRKNAYFMEQARNCQVGSARKTENMYNGVSQNFWNNF